MVEGEYLAAIAKFARLAALAVATACLSTMACNRENSHADSAKRTETERRSAEIPLYPASCQQAGEAKKLAPADILALKGEYTILVATAESPPRVFNGKLQLFATDSAHRFLLTRQPSDFGQSARRPELLLYGWTSLDTDRFASGSVLYPVSSHDVDRPGVQLDSRGEMVLGNATGPAGMAFDTGIYFSIVAVDSVGFSGTWAAGYTRRPLPHGFFCAIRTRSAR
jgi:hypothetical protein